MEPAHRLLSTTEPRCAISTSSSLPSAFTIFGVWRVRVECDAKRLDRRIDAFQVGRSRPECGGQECEVYRTAKKTWRHLSAFQHEAYMHVRTPRALV
jgi:hypothetical protein